MSSEHKTANGNWICRMVNESPPRVSVTLTVSDPGPRSPRLMRTGDCRCTRES